MKRYIKSSKPGIGGGTVFETEVLMPEAEFNKWKRAVEKEGVAYTVEYDFGGIGCYVTRNGLPKHIGTWFPDTEVLACDDISLFGNYIDNSRRITSARNMRTETVENFPKYMVGYAAYGEDSLGLTDEDIQNFEKWRKRNGYGSLLSVDGYGDFSSHPAFGLACDVVPVTFSVIENSRRPIKSNATDDVRQIALFIENDGQLYRQMIVPVIKNLERKVNKGDFDKEKALIAWQHVADEGTKKYNKEFGSGKDSVLPFNTATRKEVAKQLMEYYEENYMGDNPITSSKENKAEESGPHMQFKKLDEDKKAELREQIEDELEAQLNKLHVKFDVDTWDNTVEYILSFFEEDNGYNPKDAKTAVHEWYLDTKEEFPEMFEQDAGKKKIASALYNSRIQGKLIGSARKPIKSSYEYARQYGWDFVDWVAHGDKNFDFNSLSDEKIDEMYNEFLDIKNQCFESSRKPISNARKLIKSSSKYTESVIVMKDPKSDKYYCHKWVPRGQYSVGEDVYNEGDTVLNVGLFNGSTERIIFLSDDINDATTFVSVADAKDFPFQGDLYICERHPLVGVRLDSIRPFSKEDWKSIADNKEPCFKEMALEGLE